MPEAQTTQARFEQNEVYFADMKAHGTPWYVFQVVTLPDTDGFMYIKDRAGIHRVSIYTTRPQSQAVVVEPGLHGYDGSQRLSWADLPASEVFDPQWVQEFLETIA